MDIEIRKENDVVILLPKSKIDFVVAPEFESVIESQSNEGKKMIIDMESVEYISSAGLRAILYADELMSDKEGLELRNVSNGIKEILDISGFSNVLTIN